MINQQNPQQTPLTSLPPISSVPKPPSNQLKTWIIFIILGVLIAGIIGAGVWWVLKVERGLGRSEKETVSVNTLDLSAWQTYKNDKYGFEVKYPKGWIVNEAVSNESSFGPSFAEPAFASTGDPQFQSSFPSLIDIIFIPFKGAESSDNNIQIIIYLNKEKRSFAEVKNGWLNNFYEIVSRASVRSSVKDVLVNQIPAQRITTEEIVGEGEEHFAIRRTDVFFSSPNNNFIFQFASPIQEFNSTLDDMLSTFKFTK